MFSGDFIPFLLLLCQPHCFPALIFRRFVRPGLFELTLPTDVFLPENFFQKTSAALSIPHYPPGEDTVLADRILNAEIPEFVHLPDKSADILIMSQIVNPPPVIRCVWNIRLHSSPFSRQLPCRRSPFGIQRQRIYSCIYVPSGFIPAFMFLSRFLRAAAIRLEPFIPCAST